MSLARWIRERWRRAATKATIDPHAQQRVPRLTLNVDDDTFFRHHVLADPDSPDRADKPTRGSHRLIAGAFALAHRKVKSIVESYSQRDKAKALLRWVDYLK